MEVASSFLEDEVCDLVLVSLPSVLLVIPPYMFFFVLNRGLMRQHIDSFDHFITTDIKQIVAARSNQVRGSIREIAT
jgi:hypothetical protein